MNNKIAILIIFNLLFSQEIGFVGDSTTENGYPRYTGGWFINPKIIKYASPGAGVIRAPYLYKDTQEFQDVLIRRPEFTIMLLGSDDFWIYSGKEIEWRTEYKYLVNALSKNSTLILGTILNRLNESKSDAPIQAMNSVIRDIANDLGLKIADFNSAIGRNTDFFFTDGIHPNDTGQKKMAETAAHVILQYLVSPPNPSDNTPPEIPKNLQSNCGNNCVTLTWDANTETDLSLYFIFRDTVDIGMGKGIKTLHKNYTCFTDTNVVNGMTYYYRIAAGDTSNNRSNKSDPVSAIPILLSIEDYGLVNKSYLNQNYPNPFNQNTKIKYQISRDCQVAITIFDIEGNKVKSLLDKFEHTGSHFINWDSTDDFGSSVSAGTYLYQIVAGQYVQTRKMILIK